MNIIFTFQSARRHSRHAYKFLNKLKKTKLDTNQQLPTELSDPCELFPNVHRTKYVVFGYKLISPEVGNKIVTSQ